MNTRSGYPGCPPAGQARFHDHSRAKNQEGACHGTKERQTPHGRTPHACGQAAHISKAGKALYGGEPWPVSEPEPWEATAVDLTQCTNRQKNQAWRKLKTETPDEAQAIARDLPKLQAAFGSIGIHVAADYIEE